MRGVLLVCVEHEISRGSLSDSAVNSGSTIGFLGFEESSCILGTRILLWSASCQVGIV